MTVPGTANPPRLGAWCQLGGSVLVEVTASAGYDWIGIDRQHGLIGLETTVSMLQAAAVSGTPAFVRTETSAPHEIMKALDAGAAGVIVPDVDDGATAHSAVEACRYPPLGHRSWGPTRAALMTREYSSHAADEAIQCFVMIESAAALARADEIASTPGISGVFVGPVDLALSCTGEVDSGFRSVDALDRLRVVAQACGRAGVVAGTYAGTASNSRVALDLGYTFVAVQSDVGTLISTGRRTLTTLRKAEER